MIVMQTNIEKRSRGDMQVTLSKSLLTKIIIAAVLLIAGSGVFVYKLTLHQVDQKYKSQQSSGGSIPISTSGLSKDFVSLNGGNPQSGNINLNGDIFGSNVQGQTLTSNVQDGTSPLNVNSSTLVKNLNADMVDGKHADELSKPTVNNITNTTTGETIQPGTNADYYRGDKSWQTLDKSAVGLSNVENTALSTWFGSASIANLGTIGQGIWNAGAVTSSGAVQGTVLASNIQTGMAPLSVNSTTMVANLNAEMVGGKHASDFAGAIPDGLTSQYFRGDKTWQALDKSAVGLSNVENTALSTWTGSGDVAILGTVTSGTWNAGSINAAGSITGTALQGTSLDLGSGTIASGAINGQTISSSANFTGTITAVGAINGATISGGTLSGGNISGGTIQGGTLSSTAVNGVTTANILVNTGSYSDPSWLSSLAGSKVTGDIAGNAGGLAGTPNITVGTINSGNITSSGTLDITGTGNSVVGGNITINPDYGSELVTNGNFNGNTNGWVVSCTGPTCTTPDTPNSVPASGWSYSSNSVSHASGTNNTDALYQDISNTTGETYGTPVINENFNSNPSATWGTGWTWTGSAMRHDSGQTAYLYGGFTATPGQIYKISFTTSNMTPGTRIAAYFGKNVQTVTFTGNGRHTFYAAAGAASGSVYLVFTYSSVAGSVTLDDIYAAPVTGAAYLENSLQSYQVTFTISGMTAGSVAANLGGENGSSVTANGTYTQYLKAASNANFISFIPSNNAVFTVSNVTVAQVQNGTITVQDIITRGGPKVDVRAFGAKCDGMTNDTAAIQAAEDSLPDSGGTLYFPKGTCIGSLIVKSHTHITGDGINASILELPSNANTDVIESKDFNSLTGTDDRGGAMAVSMDNITIDGNQSVNSSGYCLRKYGAQWNIHDVVFKNCTSGGIYSEWGNYLGIPPNADSMEDKWNNIWVTNNGGTNAIWMKGPHDSIIENSLIYSNAGNGIYVDHSGSTFNGGGMSINNTHIWGNSTTGYGVYTNTALRMTGSIVEGAGGAGGVGVYVGSGYDTGVLTATGVEIFSNTTGILLDSGSAQNTISGAYIHDNTNGLEILSSNNNEISDTFITGQTGYGLQFGDAAHIVSGVYFSGRLAKNATDINWSNSSNANNYIDALISTTSGQTAISSTPSSSNKLNIFTSGSGTNTNLSNTPGQLQVESTQTSGTLATIAAPSATTLTGSLTGQIINLKDNYTITGQGVLGQYIKMPGVTNTGSGSYWYQGDYIGTGDIVQNTAAGSDNWSGFVVSEPNITATTGSVTAIGLELFGGTVTGANAHEYSIIVNSGAGNVGIGTTAPASLLTVNAPVTADASTVTTMVASANAANKGLVVQGFTSQTADLIQGQDSLGNVLFSVSSAGNLTAKAASFTGTLTLTGHFKSTQTTAPTIGTPSSCGTTPTASMATGSTDSAGSLTITAGTGSPGNCAAIVTFNAAYGAAPKSIILTPKSSTGPAKQAYISASAANTFTITFGTAPAASEANSFYYWIIE